MLVKEAFLKKVRIGSQVKMMVASRKLTGRVIGIDMEDVRIVGDQGQQFTVELDTIARFKVDSRTTAVAGGVHTAIEDVGFHVRAYNSLNRAGYAYLEELEGLSSSELFKIRNLGRKGVEEVIRVCRKHGVSTGADYAEDGADK